MVDLSHLDLRLDLLDRWASKESGVARKAIITAAVRRKAPKEAFDRGPWTVAVKAETPRDLRDACRLRAVKDEFTSDEMPNRYLLLNWDCSADPPTEAATINVLVGHLTPEERAVATGARQEQRVYGFYQRVRGMPERMPVVVRERMVCIDVGGDETFHSVFERFSADHDGPLVPKDQLIAELQQKLATSEAVVRALKLGERKWKETRGSLLKKLADSEATVRNWVDHC